MKKIVLKHDPQYVQDRKPLTKNQRLAVYMAARGRCEACGKKITLDEMIDEHVLPLWLGSEGPESKNLNSLENRKCFCEDCATGKTAKEATERAKGRRVAKKHYTEGKITKTKPLPFGKRSKFKKKLDGTVVRRVSR